ncbi:chemotaxis protein CheX [Pseudobdellovibrio sp. HCB154]|uniref:chemotaxis protein CheX n=1 Tax=Pseudobdellovibrio sp. HCB154 TaxID=3386277 RepID=UPI0039175F58
MSTALKLSTLKHPIFEKLVVENICAGIQGTLAQLGPFKTEFKPHFFAATWQVPTPISVIVNIKQNEQPLQVRFHFDPKPVVEILEGMLGDKVDPESQDILDGVGEISNMIYGLIKTKASTAGFQFGMGRPEACFTKNLPPNVNPNGQSLVIPFTVNGGICHFEFIVFD